MGSTGNITKALQAIAKFEELVRANLVILDIPGKQLIVKERIIPEDELMRLEWKKEAFLYFKFKATHEFDEFSDTLTILSKDNKQTIDQLRQEDLLNSKTTYDIQPCT